jgi:hypothetical protein
MVEAPSFDNDKHIQKWQKWANDGQKELWNSKKFKLQPFSEFIADVCRLTWVFNILQCYCPEKMSSKGVWHDSVCVCAFGSAGCLDTGSAFCWWSLAWWLLPRTENDDWCLWFLWIIANSLYMYAWFGLIWCFCSRSRKHWTSFQRSCRRGVSLLICHWHHAGALFVFALMVAISTLNVVYTQSFGFNLGGASLISL